MFYCFYLPEHAASL